MRILILWVLLVMGLRGEVLDLMTFNIRYADSGWGKTSWWQRKQIVVEAVEKINPDIMGVQEALTRQVNYLDEKLPKYRWVGVGREDGKTKGEFSAVFYRQDRFDELGNGTFWLSDTPKVAGSVSWDNVCERICTWVRLRDRRSGRTLLVMNNHWDHKGRQSRLKSADLVLEQMKKLRQVGDEVVVMGDFNAGEGSPSLRLLGKSLVNGYISLHAHSQKRGTLHRWTGRGDQSATIDHIFLSKGLKVKKAWIDLFEKGGRWPSDHFPVVVSAEVLK